MKIQWSPFGTPYSTEFKDIYFNDANGLEESRFVFLDEGRISGCWDTEKNFVVAELGFGTGLNFFTLWDHWSKSAVRPKKLLFKSVEKFLLDPEEIKTSLSRWPELEKKTEEFLSLYQNQINFELEGGAIHFQLFHGDVEEFLLTLPRGSIDYWFLDGFAPSRNPQMWTENVFQGIGHGSRLSAQVQTFSAAGIIRRSLLSQGFQVERVKGFGNKRERIRATRSLTHQPIEPWYCFTRPTRASLPEEITVIGAGIAGCAIAERVCREGVSVRLLESESEPALGASGNPWGLLSPLIMAGDHPIGRFANLAFEKSLDILEETFEDHELPPPGGFQLAYQESLVTRFQEALKHGSKHYSVEHKPIVHKPDVHWMDALEVSEQLGTRSNFGGLFIRRARVVPPRELCARLLRKCGNRLSLQPLNSVVDLSYDESKSHWKIRLESGVTLTSRLVILANTWDAARLLPLQSFPIEKIRGDLLSCPAKHHFRESLNCFAHFDGYAIPGHDRQTIIGTTFWRDRLSEPFGAADKIDLLNRLAQALPDLGKDLLKLSPDQFLSRTSFRAAFNDKLPAVGPVPNSQAFVSDFGKILIGRSAQSPSEFEIQPGLFVSVGHGSRGLSLGLLAADLLWSQISGEKSEIPQEDEKYLLPVRHLIKKIRREH